jgi:hypothetical protein
MGNAQSPKEALFLSFLACSMISSTISYSSGGKVVIWEDPEDEERRRVWVD